MGNRHGRHQPVSGHGVIPCADDLDLLEAAVSERRCRERIGAGTLDEAVGLWRAHPPCPDCGFPGGWRNGRTPAGHARWLCPECGSRFSALTGTALEYGEKELPTWERFITCMCYNAPLDLIAGVCGIARTAAFEWRHRVFATVDGYQDRLVLGGRVRIDGLYLTDSDIVRGARFVQKRACPRTRPASPSRSTRSRTRSSWPAGTASPPPSGSRTRCSPT